jgi:hypothetical protein
VEWVRIFGELLELVGAGERNISTSIEERDMQGELSLETGVHIG